MCLICPAQDAKWNEARERARKRRRQRSLAAKDLIDAKEDKGEISETDDDPSAEDGCDVVSRHFRAEDFPVGAPLTKEQEKDIGTKLKEKTRRMRKKLERAWREEENSPKSCMDRERFKGSYKAELIEHMAAMTPPAIATDPAARYLVKQLGAPGEKFFPNSPESHRIWRTADKATEDMWSWFCYKSTYEESYWDKGQHCPIPWGRSISPKEFRRKLWEFELNSVICRALYDAMRVDPMFCTPSWILHANLHGMGLAHPAERKFSILEAVPEYPRCFNHIYQGRPDAPKHPHSTDWRPSSPTLNAVADDSDSEVEAAPQPQPPPQPRSGRLRAIEDWSLTLTPTTTASPPTPATTESPPTPTTTASPPTPTTTAFPETPTTAASPETPTTAPPPPLKHGSALAQAREAVAKTLAAFDDVVCACLGRQRDWEKAQDAMREMKSFMESTAGALGEAVGAAGDGDEAAEEARERWEEGRKAYRRAAIVFLRAQEDWDRASDAVAKMADPMERTDEALKKAAEAAGNAQQGLYAW